MSINKDGLIYYVIIRIRKLFLSLRRTGIKSAFLLVYYFFYRRLKNRKGIDIQEEYPYEFINQVDFAKPQKLEPPDYKLDPKRLNINWIMTDMEIGSGGHTTIFRTIHFLEKFGHKNTVYIMGKSKYGNGKDVKDIITKHFIKLDSDVVVGTDAMKECDVLIATSWVTAYPAYNFSKTRKRFYFVQDMEHWFHPVNAEYVFAENTYSKMRFSCITAGRWLNEVMRDKYNLESDYFELAYDSRYYKVDKDIRRENDSICFYARSSTARRGIELGILALKKVQEKYPNLNIELYGSDTWKLNVPLKYKNRGVLSFQELADLYNKSAIGVVFSLTNYSLIPQEMMACGLPVVDLKGENTETIYKHNEVFLADRDPASVADVIIKLLKDRNLRKEYSKRGLAFVENLSWESSAKDVERILLKNLT